MKRFILLAALFFTVSGAVQAKDCSKKIEKQIARMDKGTIFDYDLSEERPEDNTLESFRVAVSCEADHRAGVNIYDVTVNEECDVINVIVRKSVNCH